MPSPTCLTVELVEEFQQLATLGKPIEHFVRPLQSATLPGVMEYGCLRFSNPNLPELPQVIWSSRIGTALQQVRSHLGLRTAGPQREPPRSMAPNESEFYVLEGTDPQETQPWTEFLVRFRQSCVSVGFEIKKATGLGAALHEMADNAVNHANV